MPIDRKTPGVAFWATIWVTCLSLLYVLSFGPTCWAVDRGYLSARNAGSAFGPLICLQHRCHGNWIGQTLRRYAVLETRFDPGWTMLRIEDTVGLHPYKLGGWGMRDYRPEVPH
jgi:hypothetical protein